MKELVYIYSTRKRKLNQFSLLIARRRPRKSFASSRRSSTPLPPKLSRIMTGILSWRLGMFTLRRDMSSQSCLVVFMVTFG